jgi:Protein of unknown function (DUF1571)
MILARGVIALVLCLPAAPNYPQLLRWFVYETPPPELSPEQRGHLLAVLAAAPQCPFPALLPWPALGQADRLAALKLEPLPFDDPLVFLEKCVERYDKEVQGYSCILWKQERVEGKMHNPEVVQVYFRERPFSVFMRWLEGASEAQCALYVQGQNDDKLLALPAGWKAVTGIWAKDPGGPEARRSSRYPITEFGIGVAMKRTLNAWRKARAKDKLHVQYLGLYGVGMVGDRECYKFHRDRYTPPEEDGIAAFVMDIDRENWLQVGSVLRDVKGDLIAQYYFRDVKINPQFAPNQFDRSALTAK